MAARPLLYKMQTMGTVASAHLTNAEIQQFWCMNTEDDDDPDYKNASTVKAILKHVDQEFDNHYVDGKKWRKTEIATFCTERAEVLEFLFQGDEQFKGYFGSFARSSPIAWRTKSFRDRILYLHQAKQRDNNKNALKKKVATPSLPSIRPSTPSPVITKTDGSPASSRARPGLNVGRNAGRTIYPGPDGHDDETASVLSEQLRATSLQPPASPMLQGMITVKYQSYPPVKLLSELVNNSPGSSSSARVASPLGQLTLEKLKTHCLEELDMLPTDPTRLDTFELQYTPDNDAMLRLTTDARVQKLFTDIAVEDRRSRFSGALLLHVVDRAVPNNNNNNNPGKRPRKDDARVYKRPVLEERGVGRDMSRFRGSRLGSEVS